MNIQGIHTAPLNTPQPAAAPMGQSSVNTQYFEDQLWNCAFWTNDAYTLQNLLDNTAYIDLEVTNSFGQTPLEVAAEQGNWDVANTLIDAGARWDRPLTNGKTMIHMALNSRQADTVGRLLEYGANPNQIVHAGNRETLLHKAVQNNDYEMVKLLISYYANGNACSAWSYFHASGTPLHLALSQKNFAIAQFLISVAVDVNAPNEWGETPLHVAAHYGSSYETLFQLVSAGANLNALSPCSRMTTQGTPFHVAVGQGNLHAAQYLVDLGADYTMLNQNGKDAMQIAQDKGRPNIIAFLESLGFQRY